MVALRLRPARHRQPAARQADGERTEIRRAGAGHRRGERRRGQRTGRALIPGGRALVATWAVSLLLVLLPASAGAADPLDPSFGSGGISVTKATGNGEIEAIARDRQGRLVTAGTTEFGFIVQRFGADGSLDLSFGKNGATQTVLLADYVIANAVAALPDGKILVVGQEWNPNESAHYLLTRYLPDGSLDHSFGKRGRVVAGPTMYDGEATGLAIQPDGKILVAGWAADTHFGFSGIAMRFMPDGAPDLSFSRNGYARILGGEGAFLHDIAIQPDGKIVVAGEMFSRFMMLRMLPDGRSDPSFGKKGFAISNVAPHRGIEANATDIALLPDGRILLSGSLEGKDRLSVALARYRPNGRPDPSFGEGGVVRTASGRYLAMEDMAVRRDGRIVLAGYRAAKRAPAQVAALRYLPSGRPDPSFGEGGLFSKQLAYESAATSLLVLPDGKIVIGGRSNPSRAGIHEGPGEEFTSSVLEKGEFLLMRLLR
jgi:uncharacterized delta-60 repeat protein